MLAKKYRPQMTDVGVEPTKPVIAIDEYQNQREIRIADERPLTIYLDRYEIVTLMTLGCQPELLALGYLKNQGLISQIDDIQSVQVDWQVNSAVVTTKQQNTNWQNKLGSRTVTTGCGQGTIFNDVMQQLEKIQVKPQQIKQSDVYALLKNLNAFNDVYKQAGAVHGCALCEGIEIIIFSEDVGRHNAVDAISGQMWLDEIEGNNKLFYTTGRLTSEMVIKVAQMNIPTLLSRSGITQMGLELAKSVGISLFSRAKGQHFLVYNGHENIKFDVDLPPKLSLANVKKRHNHNG